MKKKLLSILLALTFVISLIGCSSSNSDNAQEDEDKKLTYVTHSASGITFELPEEWTVETDTDDFSVTFPDGIFSISEVKMSLPKEFKFFAETYVPQMLEDMKYTVVDSYTTATYASYDAYNYEATALVQGETAPVKLTVLHVNDKALVILYVYQGDAYDYEAIYSHFLDSIN